MARTFGTYTQGLDTSWYDSSNILYSRGIENGNGLIDLILVFNGGRKYLYKNVTVEDYLNFRNDASQGKALRKYIVVKEKDGSEKYKCMRLADVDLKEIEEEKKKAMEKQILSEKANKGNTCYTIIANPNTGKFKLYLADEVIYEGHVDHVSIFPLLRAMNIVVDTHFITEEENMEEEEKEVENADCTQ